MSKRKRSPHDGAEKIVGRELDALVAEKVFEGTISRFRGDVFYVGRDRDEPGWVTETRIPHYSTDIGAAWKIVEEMRQRGWVYCTVQSLPTKAEMPEWDDATMSVQWWVEFSRYRSPVEATSPHCTTSAEAICLAALQAVDA